MPITRSQETILIIEAMNIGTSGASASNKRSAFVVEPEGANKPSARRQIKMGPMWAHFYLAEVVWRERVSGPNSLYQGKIQGIYLP